ncbi:flagellar biosynthesis protein FlgI, partial [Stenotrophomonas geniculata]
MAMKLFLTSSWQRRVASFAALMLLAVTAPASAERIKDLAQVGGVRGNAL